MPASDKSRAAGNPFPFAYSLPDAAHLLLAGPHMHAAMMTIALGRQKEGLDFLEHRCAAQLSLAKDIGKATTFTDMFTALADFTRQAFADYGEEARVFAEHGAQGAIAGVRVVQEETAKCCVAPLREAA